jgi:heme/copper-type cytochrome/quinol oxidase subunit 2
MVKNSSTLKKKKKEEEEANQMGSFGLFHFEIRLANHQKKITWDPWTNLLLFFFIIIIIIIIFLIMFYFIIHFTF